MLELKVSTNDLVNLISNLSGDERKELEKIRKTKK
jgi:hypothetical protein